MKYNYSNILNSIFEYIKDRHLINKIKNNRLTYLNDKKIRSILDEIKILNERKVEGCFLEMGVALGGSAVLIASKCKETRRFVGYDVFEMIPPPASNDFSDSHERYNEIIKGKSKGIGKDLYYGYENNLYEQVINNFNKFGIKVDNAKIKLIKGLFESTVYFEEGEKVAFAHIDCDWHDPVLLCCQRLASVLDDNGVIIVDDYNDYSGCKKAVANFINANEQFYIEKTQPHAIIKKKSSR